PFISIWANWNVIPSSLRRKDHPQGDKRQAENGGLTLSVKGTAADESDELYKMDKIREYARTGYAPFFFQKGLVESWNPANRWEFPLVHCD
ncbi:MAG: hypothetical protein ACKPKO_17705, partial [Candidatus Fonsibacter sp.]